MDRTYEETYPLRSDSLPHSEPCAVCAAVDALVVSAYLNQRQDDHPALYVIEGAKSDA
jgi:hypothetical protein